MNLSEVLRKECIKLKTTPQSKDEALRELAALAKQSDKLEALSEDDIYSGFSKREALGSTGFGGGIAIPHCRLDGIEEFVVGIMVVPEGVDFEAADDEKVKLLVFIVGPEGESNEHIHLLSGISLVLHAEEAVNEIINGASDEAVYESFLRHCSGEAHDKASTEKAIFHVFVQDEDLFSELLQAFAAVDSSHLLVLEANKAGIYVSNVPLFAGFWSDDYRGFNRIIVAVVARDMINETVRLVEKTTGPLKNCTNVMVTVQNLRFASGALTY